MIGPKVRLVSGPVPVVEKILNEEWETYVINSLTYTVVKDELICTALLISASEVRKAAMMNPGAMPMGRPQ
jgi:hypothetical protein